jgi:hypothetical protein
MLRAVASRRKSVQIHVCAAPGEIGAPAAADTKGVALGNGRARNGSRRHRGCAPPAIKGATSAPERTHTAHWTVQVGSTIAQSKRLKSFLMAARKRRGTLENAWDDSVPLKIKTSMLINRLSDHVFKNVDISITQMKAIEILLKKTLPDLSSVAMTMDDKRNASDWNRDELVAFLRDARNGSGGIAEEDGRNREPDSVH